MKYQLNYSRNFPSIKEEGKRRDKAHKISRALLNFLERENLNDLLFLDLGSSTGIIDQELSLLGAKTVGMDIDFEAIYSASHLSIGDQLCFITGDAGNAPFKNAQFDLILCSQVYEHVPDVNLLIGEIKRLLKPGGVCFFSGPNKWAIMEDHYNLPFLSWVPRKLANAYVRFMKKGDEYYEKPLSAVSLHQKLSDFEIMDLSKQLLQYPEMYAMQSEVGRFSEIFRRLPNFSWKLINQIVPNFNWLLIKRDQA